MIPPQEASRPERRVLSGGKLSFNPWHALPGHQPLGSILRVRIKAYRSSTALRRAMKVQPRDIRGVPA